MSWCVLLPHERGQVCVQRRLSLVCGVTAVQAPTSPLFNIRVDRVQACLAHFGRLGCDHAELIEGVSSDLPTSVP